MWMNNISRILVSCVVGGVEEIRIIGHNSIQRDIKVEERHSFIRADSSYRIS